MLVGFQISHLLNIFPPQVFALVPQLPLRLFFFFKEPFETLLLTSSLSPSLQSSCHFETRFYYVVQADLYLEYCVSRLSAEVLGRYEPAQILSR